MVANCQANSKIHNTRDFPKVAKTGVSCSPMKPYSDNLDPASVDLASGSAGSLRAEIAACAARMIAEDGADYHSAKRHAVQQILGNGKTNGANLPDNIEIEDQVRIYNELFLSDTQPARLLHLRQLAAILMQDLATFAPHLTGAALNGTAGEHSDIHLQCFVDSVKDVEIELLNRHIDFEVSESASDKPHSPLEILSFMWRNEGVHLALHDYGDMRNLPKTRLGRMMRCDLDGLQALIAASQA